MSRVTTPAREKLVDRSDLTALLELERRAGNRVVFTNGCFDLLHAGHLKLLETAASLGEILVVGINHDATVRRLKGPSRPVVPFRERALLVAGLTVVDWVVGFDEPTPLPLIEALHPEVLVKGGDWAPDRIVGREFVEARGGRVVSVPLLSRASTSRMVARIREREPLQ